MEGSGRFGDMSWYITWKIKPLAVRVPEGGHTQEDCSPDEVGQLLLVERGIGKRS